MNDIISQQIINDPAVRKDLAYMSHYWFFHLYLSHYVKYQTADFQKEIFQLTEKDEVKTIVIVAFRGSAKSTIMTLSYPLWAMLGRPGKKFITIIGLTQQQSRLILSNIKSELENNQLLINDFGPFGEENDEWRVNSLVISQYQTRITALSTGEGIRGLRHLSNRPDLIICDDVEDLESVKTQESRDNTYRWLTGEVIPMGDKDTKVIVIGNLLHEDSLIMRLKKQLQDNPQTGVFKSFPVTDDQNNILWPGKYPTLESLEEERKKIGDIAWKREYLLVIVPDTDCVVRPEWLHYYDSLPAANESGFRYAAIGIDLAISEKETADFTAMVSAYVFGFGEKIRVCILPYPFNQRVDFPTTVRKIKEIASSYRSINLVSKILIEEVAYQSALPQHLKSEGITTIGIKIHGQDKRARLSQTTSWIQTERILFPKSGAEELINQLVGFGVEKHDDLADAFSILIFQIMQDNHQRGRVFSFKPDGF